MGLFSWFFKSGKGESIQANSEKQDFSYVSEIAGLISGNNPGVMENVNACIEHPVSYSHRYEDRYMERGIYVDDVDNNEICWIGMVDELSEYGYLFSVDYKCELEDFLWALSQINNYSLIESTVSGLTLDETQNVDTWGEEINAASGGRAYICIIDIDSDSYELIIVTADVYEKISSIAGANGHTIEYF